MAANEKPLPKYLSQEEVGRLLEQPNIASTIGLRDRVIMEVMAYAGLRVSEVVALKPADITWRGPAGLPVLHILEGKGGKDRNMTVRERTGQWLRQWDKQRHSHAGPFFHTCAGRSGGAITSRLHSNLSRKTVYGAVKRYAAAAGLPSWVTPHTLRHTFAMWMISDRGEPTAVVQAMLGHEHIQTTEIYTRCADAQVTAAMQRASRAEADQQSLDAQPSAFATAIAAAVDTLPEAEKRELVERLGLA